jgi:MFS family permease
MKPAPNYKWYILVLAGLTNTLAVAAPSLSLPVLFKEISMDLHLDLVQIGVIWGIGSLPGILTALLGGSFGDRFGPRRVILFGTLLVGLAGCSRGLAYDYLSFGITVFLFGSLTPLITMNGIKTCGIWFPKHQLGFANGVLSMGMALGFLSGTLISATILSPWLGGWRQVMFFYGFLAILLSIPWYFTPSGPDKSRSLDMEVTYVPMHQALIKVASLKNIWLLGLTLFGISGCIQGALGYLPLYLRQAGWPAVRADSASATFHAASLLFVLPIALWSDRLSSRKKLLFIMSLMFMTGIGLLTIVAGPLIWGCIILAGMARDGFMAVFITMILETEGVGPVYTGTATGFVMIFSGIGNLIAPPVGNRFAEIFPGLPFAIWAGFAVVGIFIMTFIKTPKISWLPKVVKLAKIGGLGERK